MKTEHILIMRFFTPDEVAMLVPVVRSLAQQYPDLRVTVLSQPSARPLFEDMAHNVGFMAADLNCEYHGVKGLNALYRRLVAKNFTAIADMHNFLRSSYLRMRFNLSSYRVEHIDNHRHSAQPLPSLTDDYIDVLARLGYEVSVNNK